VNDKKKSQYTWTKSKMISFNRKNLVKKYCFQLTRLRNYVSLL